MEKIVLFTFVFLATVVMIHGNNNTTTPTPPATSPHSNVSSTAELTTKMEAKPTTGASAVIQPLAIFVLACAFLGLMH